MGWQRWGNWALDEPLSHNSDDRLAAMHKRREHNSYLIASSVTGIPVPSPDIPATPFIIPAKAGIHRTKRSARPTRTGLPDCV